jgi:hypothetical protein
VALGWGRRMGEAVATRVGGGDMRGERECIDARAGGGGKFRGEEEGIGGRIMGAEKSTAKFLSPLLSF